MDHNDEAAWLDTPEIRVLLHDRELHYGWPRDSLLARRCLHLNTDQRCAVWTSRGGVIACREHSIAAAVEEAIAATGDDLALCSQLQAIAAVPDPRRYYLNLEFYCDGPVPHWLPPPSICVRRVTPDDDMVRALDRTPPEMEYAMAVVEEGAIVSWATRRGGGVDLGTHRAHAVGVWTDPGHRGLGLGKAVVGALVRELADEGAAALWNCDVRNLASVRLARAVGFRETLRFFHWPGPEG